jgi:flagellar hook-basal body complex protein FliE
MLLPISSPPQTAISASLESTAQAGRSGGFAKILTQAVDRVELSQTAADQAVNRFLSGEGDDLHGTALSVQRAELEFELMLQVRNKVVQAYQEIMRMQV